MGVFEFLLEVKYKSVRVYCETVFDIFLFNGVDFITSARKNNQFLQSRLVAVDDSSQNKKNNSWSALVLESR